MKYKTIFIANIAEISLQLVRFLDKEKAFLELDEDHRLSDRFIFSGGDDRILITPYLLDKDFLKDTARVFNYKNLENLAPSKINGSICEAIWEDKKLRKRVIMEIEEIGGIKIISYAATKEFYELVDKFKKLGLKFETPECPDEKSRWTQEFFGSKAGFRQVGKDIPEGVIAGSTQEVVGWGKYLLEKKGGIVVKFNHGLAGAGLKIILRKEIKGNVEDFLWDLVNKEKYFQVMPVVVEEYVESLNELSVEMGIFNNKVRVLYSCGMRVSDEGVFGGVEVGNLSKKIENKMEKIGKNLGELYKSFGYQGYFDCDMVLGKDGKIYSLETNLRRTGGTHVWEIAKALLKNDWQKFYMIAVNGFLVPGLKVTEYKSLKVRTRDLFFDKDKKEGVVMTVVSLLKNNRIGYVVVGKNRERAMKIEKKFLKSLC